MNRIVELRLARQPHRYAITIGAHLIEKSGIWAQKILPSKTRKIAIITNSKVFSYYGTVVQNSFEKKGFECQVFKMGDGERFKSLRTLENITEFLGKMNLKRTDAVVALGGGVVGDVAGFAAAVYLRGVAFLQIPTSLLAMIDSSVGGKTGVNTAFGKNMLGAFYQPLGVLVDIGVLKTLADREMRAGFYEAVKHGALAGKNLFEQTSSFLSEYKSFHSYPANRSVHNQLIELISAQVSFKARIVTGDQSEDFDRCDSLSRKILNFGHTVGHALEKATDYTYFKHGEAIGYGMLAAAEISKTVANFPELELKSLREAIASTGRLPTCKKIDSEKIISSLAFDKKNIGKNLQWILLKRIGQPVVIDNSKIPPTLIKRSIEEILGKS